MIDTIVVEEKNGTKKIAGLKEGVLREFLMQKDGGFNEGNIYLGRITKKIHTANGKDGYFVNIGAEKEAFINAQERELEDLKANEGQDVVVQIIQEQRAEKGPRVSRFLQLAGEYLVFCPYGSEIEISSKIVDEDKKEELYNLVVANCQNGGWIIRTFAAEVAHEDIVEEAKKLEDVFDKLLLEAKKAKAPSRLFIKDNVLEEFINRNKDTLQKVVVDNHLTQEKIKNLAETEYLAKTFEQYGIEEMLEEALHKIVKLPCGGRIIIEETKACVVIDVDSGEGTAQGGLGRLNQEAAYEIAKQIVLRNLAGKIIIDFAGIAEFKFLKYAMDILQQELQNDVSKTKVLGLSRAGNVELLRIRRRPTLCDLLSEECPTCRGTGRVEK